VAHRGARLLLEDARTTLTVEEWRAFVYVLTDALGLEAAKLVVAEALQATEDAA